MKKSLALIAFLFGLFLFGTMTVEACSCMTMSSCEAYARAKIVFTGKIVKATDEQGIRKHQVQIEENFLGMENIPLVNVFTGTATSCAFSMTEGEDYLIFAWKNEETGELWTGMCSHTAQTEFAGEDLEYLRSVKSSGKSGGTVKGLVINADGDRENPRKPEQVDKVFIEKSDGQKFEADIQPDGKYELTGLTEGKYRISIDLPKGLITEQDASSYAADENMNPKFIDVAGKGCTTKNFEVKINGVISGKVFDADGIPVKERRVNLLRLADPNKIKNQNQVIEQSAEIEDEADEDETQTVAEPKIEAFEGDFDDYTEDDGSFSFKGLPPGRYLLGVEIGGYLNINLNEDQYSPTYFPGSRKKETAIIIELKKSEILTDKNIQLFPKLKKRIITGQVVLKNGRAVSKIESMIYAKREGNSDTEWMGDLKIDAKGNFTLEAFEETEYLIQVIHYTGKKIDENIEEGFSNKCLIIPKNGLLKPIKLVLEAGSANCDESEFRK